MLSLKNSSGLGDEETLISKASRGDLDSFNQLALAYQNTAYSHAYAILGERASSEDATQESFTKAFQNLAGFRGGSFRAWLLKIVTNSAYDILRQSSRHATQPLLPEDENGEEIESPAWLADPVTPVPTTVEQNEDSQHLYQMLDELSGEYRSVITLVDIYELEYTEAARILKVPIGTIKSRLARARLQMQQKIQSSQESFEASARLRQKQVHKAF